MATATRTFSGQNFFAVNGDTSRYAARRGLWLHGDGQVGFRAGPGQESGVKVYGEQGGAAVCDFDGDGRPDLVVTKRRPDPTISKRHRQTVPARTVARPGGKPKGIGAVVRLTFGDRLGPAGKSTAARVTGPGTAPSR